MTSVKNSSSEKDRLNASETCQRNLVVKGEGSTTSTLRLDVFDIVLIMHIPRNLWVQ